MADAIVPKSSRESSAQEFVASLEEKLMGGIVGLGVAMGMQTGLFEVLIRLGGEPKTSQEIADAANFKERYVREWLGSMASAGIVDFNAKAERFWLPSHRSNIMELKVLALVPPILSGGFHQVADCFKKDGPSGVGSEFYPKFDELMGLAQGPFFRDNLVQDLIPSMPHAHKQLNEGIQVLDVGCGVGLSTRTLAAHFPRSRFVGADLSEPALAEARRSAAAAGVGGNTEFVGADAARMPADWSGRFQLVLANLVLHDLSHPAEAVGEIHRVLAAGGTLSVIETNAYSSMADNLTRFGDQGRVNMEYTYSLYNCMPTSLSRPGGAGLGAFWGREEAQRMLEAAGLEVCAVTEVNADFLHLMCRKP